MCTHMHTSVCAQTLVRASSRARPAPSGRLGETNVLRDSGLGGLGGREEAGVDPSVWQRLTSQFAGMQGGERWKRVKDELGGLPFVVYGRGHGLRATFMAVGVGERVRVVVAIVGRPTSSFRLFGNERATKALPTHGRALRGMQL